MTAISTIAECSPLRGRLLWSLRADTNADVGEDMLSLAHPQVGARGYSSAEWLPDVVYRMGLGPVDLANSPHLARDAQHWHARTRETLHTWPAVQRWLDDLGGFVVPWYALGDGRPPILGLPAVIGSPAPFRLPELGPDEVVRLVSGTTWTDTGGAVVVSAPGADRAADLRDTALIDLVLGRDPAAAGAARVWPPAARHTLPDDAVHDIARCLIGAGLAHTE